MSVFAAHHRADPLTLARTPRRRHYRARHSRPLAAVRAARAALHGAALVLAAIVWPEHVLYLRLTGTAR